MAIRSVRTKGKGNVFTPQQLTKDLQSLAEEIKQYMFAEAQRSSKHQFRKSGGIIENTSVAITENGVKIVIPEYAQYIDSGRLPFAKKVPVSAIIKWIRRYRIAGRDTKGKFIKRTKDSVNSLAYAIQNGIFKNGIKARPFLEKTVKFGERLLADYVEQTLLPDLITLIEFTVLEKK